MFIPLLAEPNSTIPPFVDPFTCLWTFALFLVFGCHTLSCDEGVCTDLCMDKWHLYGQMLPLLLGKMAGCGPPGSYAKLGVCLIL